MFSPGFVVCLCEEPVLFQSLLEKKIQFLPCSLWNMWLHRLIVPSTSSQWLLSPFCIAGDIVKQPPKREREREITQAGHLDNQYQGWQQQTSRCPPASVWPMCDLWPQQSWPCCNYTAAANFQLSLSFHPLAKGSAPRNSAGSHVPKQHLSLATVNTWLCFKFWFHLFSCLDFSHDRAKRDHVWLTVCFPK
jgi:hypothetical protein